VTIVFRLLLVRDILINLIFFLQTLDKIHKLLTKIVDRMCTMHNWNYDMIGDPLRLSSNRISEYKALASPSLIALSSTDPLMTAFKLSWELRELAVSEPESRAEYLKLRRQVEK